jgi:hypothetical protein
MPVEQFIGRLYSSYTLQGITHEKSSCFNIIHIDTRRLRH